MKHRRTLLIIGIMLMVGSAMLFSSPSAETIRQSIQEMDLSTESIDTVIETFDKLSKQVSVELESAQEDLGKARRAGDLEAYRNAYGRIVTLSSYAMTKAETEMLLARILLEEEPLRAEHAAWLYRTSSYYRPSLSMDYTIEGPLYRYSYTQQIRKAPGESVTLPEAESIRVSPARFGVLVGWGLTHEDVEYEPGESITMPYTDQTLYAIWRNQVRFFDVLTQTEAIHEDVKDGQVIQVPAVIPPDDGYRFAGWYDTTTGKSIEGDAVTVKGNGGSYAGHWKKLTVEAVNTIYYGLDRLPVRTQVSVGFSLFNEGTVGLGPLTAHLSSDSPYVTMLTDTVHVRDIPAGKHRTNNANVAGDQQQEISGESNTFKLVFDSATPSGSVIPFTIVVQDRNGESWSFDFSFTVK